MQPLSYIERRVLDRLLEMDFQGAAQLRSQVAHIVGAERNCTCGCPSITPIIDRSVTAPALVYSTYLPVTLQEIDRDEGLPREVIAFTDPDGFLANLECVYFDDAINEWPDVDRSAVFLADSQRSTVAISLPNGVIIRPFEEGDAWRHTTFDELSFVGETVSGYREEYDFRGRRLGRTLTN